MNYEIVEMKKKVFVGLNVKTSNSNPEMPQIIGGVWQEFFTSGLNDKIRNAVNEYTVCLYSDYENNNDAYQVTIGKEVTSAANPELVVKEIPEGRYAKFEIHGNQVEAVGQAWSEIWNMDLDRRYTGDYEEYLNSDCDNCSINIYIALN